MIAQCLYQSDPKNLASMGRQRLACQRAARKIADIVLQEAIDNDYGIPKDDMTVLVAKIEKI